MSNGIPFNTGDQNNPSSKFKTGATPSGSELSNNIANVIGRGDDAKNSVIWRLINSIIIIYSLVILVLIINDIWHNKGSGAIKIIKETWDTFTPLLTLSLGYMFGKRERED